MSFKIKKTLPTKQPNIEIYTKLTVLCTEYLSIFVN